MVASRPTVAFVGSPLLPAFRGGIRGRALRLVVLTHVFAYSNPDGFGFLINANFLKSAPDCNGALIRWTNHLFFCFFAAPVWQEIKIALEIRRTTAPPSCGVKVPMGPASPEHFTWGKMPHRMEREGRDNR